MSIHFPNYSQATDVKLLARIIFDLDGKCIFSDDSLRTENNLSANNVTVFQCNVYFPQQVGLQCNFDKNIYICVFHCSGVCYLWFKYSRMHLLSLSRPTVRGTSIRAHKAGHPEFNYFLSPWNCKVQSCDTLTMKHLTWRIVNCRINT